MKHRTGADDPAKVDDHGYTKGNCHFDVIEFGCLGSGKEGMLAVAALKQAFPYKTVVADIDARIGCNTVAKMFEAGADLLRVSGEASDLIMSGLIEAAEAQHCGIVVDLSEVPDKAARAIEVLAVGAAFVEFLPGLLSRPSPSTP